MITKAEIHKKNRFRNVNGVLLLRELFYETATNKENVLYTLKNQDHEGYPSLYRLYIESNDPTEYRFATENLDGWEHWTLLRECSWFLPYLKKWRDELEVKLRAEALSKIIQKASSSDKDALQAAKYVADGWGDQKTSKGRGRPSKDEIKQEAHKIASEQKRLEEDFLRLIN